MAISGPLAASQAAKVIPGKEGARYMQIENKIRAVVKYELTAQISLIE